MDELVKQEIRKFLLDKVQNCRVMVIGGVMLDRYFYGEVSRISPEAPVPVNLVSHKKDTLGGAANVAHNLARLGCQTYLAGLMADDHHGHLLLQKMKKLGIHTEGLLVGRERTTTKVRILGGHQQMLRLDFEETEEAPLSVISELIAYVEKCLAMGLDAIILSDYGKGVCTEILCQQMIRLAREYHIPLLVDPKGKAWKKYRGADYVTPNVKETETVLGEALWNEENILRMAAKKIQRVYQIQNVMITRSEKGVSLFLKNSEIHNSTVAQEVFDVSGAGDTVIAAFAAGIGGGLETYIALKMANIAAGIEVGKLGTYAVDKMEILAVER